MEKTLAQLEQILRDQLAAHEQLSALLERKLTALRQADHAHVARCCQEENRQLQALAQLEKTRLEVVARLTLAVEPTAPEPMRLGDLAQRIDEPARSRLLVLRAQLKERMADVQRRAGVARRTTETLVAHMQGLMQTISSAITGVATYSAGGVTASRAAVSTFNATA